MSTQKAKSDAASRLAQKLNESRARAKLEEEKKEKERAKQIAKSKKNGKSVTPAIPAETKPAKKAPAKRKKAPAKKKAVSTAKAKGATQKRKVQVKKAKDPRVKKGLAKLVQSKDIDPKSGLTVFQAELVKLVQEEDEGMPISEIMLRIWPRKKIETLRQEAKETSTSTPDRWVRNAIRRPVEHGFLDRVDGRGLYRFVEWKKISPNKRSK